MGENKALVRIGGETLLDRVAGIGGRVGDVVVVGADAAIDPACIPDLRPGRLGPLAGLEAALHHADGRAVVLVGVDQPFLRAETLDHLVRLEGDVVVPVATGWAQVTCAVYRAPFLPVVQAALDTGRELAIHHLLDRADTTRVDESTWSAWGEDGRSWYSVDTPEDLAAGIERFGEGI